jgi:hypothetical protein
VTVAARARLVGDTAWWGHRAAPSTWPEWRVRQSAQPRALLRRLSYPRVLLVVTSATGLSRAAPANNMRLLAREHAS